MSIIIKWPRQTGLMLGKLCKLVSRRCWKICLKIIWANIPRDSRVTCMSIFNFWSRPAGPPSFCILKCQVYHQNLIKIYHALKSYEQCHYLTTIGWTDAQRSLVHETVLQTILDQRSSGKVRIESNSKKHDSETHWVNARQKGQMIVCHEPGCNEMKKTIQNFRCGDGHIKFQNYATFKRSPVPCFIRTQFGH